MIIKDISSIRKEYSLKKLDESEVNYNPFIQFGLWFDEILNSAIPEPNAMILSTATLDGKPSSRVVLLKQFNKNGFSFFTNYNSRKGTQIEQNPYGALVFFWPELERQVRIEGKISKASEAESDEYFTTRPAGSKLGAWASPQSQVVPNRKFVESLKVDFQNQFEGKSIPRPANWGGYRLSPTLFEFWQGRPNRLHDRIQYTLKDNLWVIERLAP
ncbi:MAG: pyridoxamine 5'-phosphate oxidase [Tenuifilaceae bacterium]